MRRTLPIAILFFAPFAFAAPPDKGANPAPSASQTSGAPIPEASIELLLNEVSALSSGDHANALKVLAAQLAALRAQRQIIANQMNTLVTQRDSTTDPTRRAALDAQINALRSDLDAIDRAIDTITAKITALRSADDAANEQKLQLRVEELKKVNDALASKADIRDPSGRVVSAERRAVLVTRVGQSVTAGSDTLRAFATARTLPKPKP